MKILSLKVQKKHKFNYAIFLIMMMLVCIGFLFVYSASFYSAGITYDDKFFFLKKQIFGAIVGCACYGSCYLSFDDYVAVKSWCCLFL